MRSPLVINGADGFLPRVGDPPKPGHTRSAVYTAMLLQILREYNNLDYKAIKGWEIRFFYDGLRAELKQSTKKA